MPSLAAPTSDNLLLGKGQVLFDRLDPLTGVSLGGMIHLGNVESFSITTDDDKVQKFSSMTAAAPLYKETNRRRNVTLKLVSDEFNADNLALIQMGTVSTLVQVATPVVAEALAATTIKGTFLKTSKLGPHTGIAVKFGAATGVLGVDYNIVNAKAGVIQILPGTAQTGAVTIDYTPPAYTSTTGPKVVAGAVSPTILGRVLFIGDPTTGPAQMVEVWRVNVTPDSALDLISEDFATLGLNMSVLDDTANHPTAPRYQTTFLP
jgi:hypothetical protein